MAAPRTKRPAPRPSTKPGRPVQRSLSLTPADWKRLDTFGDLTQWGRSVAASEALDLLVDLSVPLAQRVAALKRTSAGPALRARIRSAVETAITEAERSSETDPWAELDAALADAEGAFIRNGAPDLSERELIDAAEAGKRAYRQGRYGKSRGASAR